jgi:SNW domain-containing protein 1
MAAAPIYQARGNIAEGDEECFGGGTEEGIGRALDNDRFGLGQAQIGLEGAREQKVQEGPVQLDNDQFRLGQAQIGFEGAQEQEVWEGPVQFEKDTTDAFGVDKFLNEAKSGRKQGLDIDIGESARKEQHFLYYRT